MNETRDDITMSATTGMAAAGVLFTLPLGFTLGNTNGMAYLGGLACEAVVGMKNTYDLSPKATDHLISLFSNYVLTLHHPSYE